MFFVFCFVLFVVKPWLISGCHVFCFVLFVVKPWLILDREYLITLLHAICCNATSMFNAVEILIVFVPDKCSECRNKLHHLIVIYKKK